ncbi:MAG: hypothetical protein AB4040_10740 [Synechococcus sp.]
MTALAILFVSGFVAAVVLGTQAYFLGELTRPIHERNWKSEGFHKLAKTFTGRSVSYQDRASTPFVEAALNNISAN